MREYVVFTEEFLHSFYDSATCSYMIPLSGKAAHDMKMLRDENATLKAENTKLRELVADMWNWLAPTAVGGAAPLRGLHDRMRELGIEVGE